MFTSCRIVTRKLKLKPSYLRALRFDKYSTKVLKSYYGEVEVPDQTLSQYVWSKSENWKNRPSLVKCAFLLQFYLTLLFSRELKLQLYEITFDANINFFFLHFLSLIYSD